MQIGAVVVLLISTIFLITSLVMVWHFDRRIDNLVKHWNTIDKQLEEFIKLQQQTIKKED